MKLDGRYQRSRRRFLHQTASGAAAAALGAGSVKGATDNNAPASKVEATKVEAAKACTLSSGTVSVESMDDPLDVLVTGAGPAGLVAAIQAARLGAKTLLVEKSGILGGTTVLNGVNFPGLFHAWGKQIIAGIGWDLVVRSVALSGGKLPDFTDFRRPHPLLQVLVDKAVYAALADETLLDSGARVLLHTMPAQALWRDGLWHITLATKDGLRQVTARTVIDGTGDANLAGIAGFERIRSEALQPGTLIMRTGGYDLGKLNDPAFAELNEIALEQAHEKAVAQGTLLSSDFAGGQPMHFLRQRGNNAMHVVGIDGSTSAGKTHAEFLARQAMLRIYRFFRAQPGLEGFRIESFATECGIRETRTIRGKKTVTATDYTSGRVWEDAVCYSFYPIDVHRASGHGIRIEPLKEGVVPTIPRGAMIPVGSQGFMVAGRCVSGDQDANSAYRVQASSMAMGQAAGACAALAALRRCDVEEVPMDELRETLREHGAIVPKA